MVSFTPLKITKGASSKEDQRNTHANLLCCLIDKCIFLSCLLNILWYSDRNLLRRSLSTEVLRTTGRPELPTSSSSMTGAVKETRTPHKHQQTLETYRRRKLLIKNLRFTSRDRTTTVTTTHTTLPQPPSSFIYFMETGTPRVNHPLYSV